MGDVVVVFLIQNILIFTIMFWGLTWGAEFFFKKKVQLTSRQFYECGFRALTDLNIQFNLNFSMLCVFLVLYDVEFIFLYPLLFNYSTLSLIEFILIQVFIFLIFISLLYDLQFNTLSWQV